MDALHLLAAGHVPTFPFRWTSPYDASSPYSLFLTFFPESCPLPHLGFHSTPEQDLEPSVAEFVRAECHRIGWMPAESTDEPSESKESKESTKDPTKESREEILEKLLKLWIYKTDGAFRRLDLPPTLRPEDNAWVDGVVRVLSLVRKFNGTSEPGVAEFDAMTPENGLALIDATQPPGWGLRQRLEFLIMPYLRFHGRTDLAASTLGGELEDALPAMYIPELRPAVLRMCLEAPTAESRLVKRVAEGMPLNAAEKKDDSEGTQGTDDAATAGLQNADDLAVPSAAALALLADLAIAASQFDTTFRQLATWALGDAEVQRDVLLRRLQTHFGSAELAVLRRSVLARIPETEFVAAVARAAFDGSRFGYIKQHLTGHPAVLEAEIARLTAAFDAAPTSERLAQLMTALELVGGDTAPYVRLQRIERAFGVSPAFVRSHTPLELVGKALDSGERTYLRFTELAGAAYPDGDAAERSQVAERCVEAALADDSFDTATEFLDRGLVDLAASPTAWLAYYQTGKYLAPQWDVPRPLSVLRQQRALLAAALRRCGDADVVTVLRAWTALEQEEAAAEAAEAAAAATAANHAPERKEPERPERRQEREEETAKDQLSSMFKHGIGWVVGANK